MPRTTLAVHYEPRPAMVSSNRTMVQRRPLPRPGNPARKTQSGRSEAYGADHRQAAGAM